MPLESDQLKIPNAATPPIILREVRTEFDPQFWRDRDARLHWILFAMSLMMVCLALWLDIQNGNEIIVPVLNCALPGTCTVRRVLQVDCPGCGLTRSFVSLAHGDLIGAWRYNPAGFLMFPMFAFQIPYRILQLRRIRRGVDAIDGTRVGVGFLATVAATMLIQWAVRW